VLLNLVGNAMDALDSTEDGERRLTVQSRLAADAIEVAVSDTGPGIPPGDLPRLFGPFFTTKPGGVGVGLTVARSVVEAHGGRTWAEGSPGGATLRFTLPARAV